MSTSSEHPPSRASVNKGFRKTNLAMQSDADFRRLPPPAQHLYYVLWNRGDLSYCGVTDWRANRILTLSEGWSPDDFDAAADCLASRYFIVADDDTEECLIRSWVRFDEVLKQPRLSVSFARAYHAVSSNVLRGAIVHEAKKLQMLYPDLVGWGNAEVQEVLSQPSINPKKQATPSDPFAQGFGGWVTPGLTPSLGQTRGRVSGSVSVPHTSASASASTTHTQGTAAAARARFDEFYDIYPRKIGRGKAQKAWSAAIKKASPDEIIAGLREQLPSLVMGKRTDGDFRPHPASWLNAERWTDVTDDDTPTQRVATDPDSAWGRGLPPPSCDECQAPPEFGHFDECSKAGEAS